MYLAFYGLQAPPFQLTPDSRFFYPSHGHRGALAYLTYGLRKAEGFVVVTGDVGTGKTMLLDYLLSTLDIERFAISKIVTTQMAPDDMIRMVASGFGLDSHDRKSATVRALEAFFVDARRRDIMPLIMVDEVHNLPASSLEELRMLSNYRSKEAPVVQTVLLGQTQFREKLASPSFEQITQRVVATSHLHPLSESETRGYVEHRLRQSGWADDPEISDEVFRLVHHETGGVPRRINMLFDRLMLLGYVEACHAIDLDLAEVVVREMRLEGLLIARPTATDREGHA